MAEAFIAQIEAEAARGERSRHDAKFFPPLIRRYFIGFFGSKAVDEIGARDISTYLSWRKDYWLAGPGKDIRLSATSVAEDRSEGRWGRAPLRCSRVSAPRLCSYASCFALR